MHLQVRLNGSLEPDGTDGDPASSAMLFGRGVFTTIAARDFTPFLWEKHWRRLYANAEKLRIPFDKGSGEKLLETLNALLVRSGVKNGRIRVTLFDESPSEIWSGGDGPKTSVSILIAEKRNAPESFKVASSPYTVNSASPLAGVKSCNYLEHLMAYEEARGRGLDEAIRINERGHVASACMANLFWEQNGKLFTPSLSTGCLPGTTREFVLENFECEEVESGIKVLGPADRIFLTSAGLGVLAAAEFNGRKLDTSDHPLLNLIPN
jgi:branched-chain amino acid aminotransferase